jgi:DNA-directed RNA polymerase subunit RPC12/RpoP
MEHISTRRAADERGSRQALDRSPAVDAASEGETFGINCSECGGSLRIHEGERSVRCEYCGSALFVTRPQGVRSFLMQPKITAGKAKLAALHHLSNETLGRVKARHASIVDLELIHIPFWRLHGRLMGWVCGEKSQMIEYEVPTGGGGDGEQTIKSVREVRHAFSKLVFKRVDWSAPACVLKKLGLQGISLRTKFLSWDIFDHRLKGTQNIALPMLSERKAGLDAYNYLTKITTPLGSRVRSSRFHLCDSNLSVYYYPVYFLRYRHEGRLYTITIDGGDGRVIRGEVPPRTVRDHRRIFFVPAALAFLAGTHFLLLPVALLTVYIIDMVQSSEFILPFTWLSHRIQSIFGSEVRP